MQYPVSFTQDLKRNPYKGLYIAFEGIDGSGKTTQVEYVKTYFEKLGKKVTVTSEPQAEGVVANIIRNILSAKVKIPSRAYQNLYSADRVLNHEAIVEPSLKRGEIVLTHRSIWSTPAYGLLDLGEEYDFRKLFSVLVSQGNFSSYHQFLAPDLTFYLKVSADSAVKRLQERGLKKDIYDKKEKLAKVISGYDTLSKQFKDEMIVIDGELREEDVTREILSFIKKIQHA